MSGWWHCDSLCIVRRHLFAKRVHSLLSSQSAQLQEQLLKSKDCEKAFTAFLIGDCLLTESDTKTEVLFSCTLVTPSC